MPHDLDPQCDRLRCKPVTLGGETLYVAPLPLRQVLAVADLLPKLTKITPQNMSAELFDPVVDLIHRGLSKAHPRLSKDELLDMPITIAELLDAIPVVVEQAGGQRKEADAGESKATSGSAPSIGNGSSPG